MASKVQWLTTKEAADYLKQIGVELPFERIRQLARSVQLKRLKDIKDKCGQYQYDCSSLVWFGRSVHLAEKSIVKDAALNGRASLDGKDSFTPGAPFEENQENTLESPDDSKHISMRERVNFSTDRSAVLKQFDTLNNGSVSEAIAQKICLLYTSPSPRDRG